MNHWTPSYLFPGLMGLIALVVLPSVVRVLWATFRKPFADPTPAAGGPSIDGRSGPGIPFSLHYRAPSSAIFKPGCYIRVVRFTIPGGAADVELSTEYLDGWGPVQQGIVARTAGAADNASIPALSDRLSDLTAVLSFSANAWIGDLRLSDDANGPPATDDASQMREIDEAATGILLQRIGGHPEAATLREVLHCYRQALAYWDPEQQPFALAHLHRGLLQMTGVLIGHLAQSHGISRPGVAKMFGVSTDHLADRILTGELYRDDAVCLHASRLACQAVDSRPAVEAEDPYVVDDAHLSAARYLRASILRVLELEPSCHSRLIADPYGTPLGLQAAVPSYSQRPDRLGNRWAPARYGAPLQRGSGA